MDQYIAEMFSNLPEENSVTFFFSLPCRGNCKYTRDKWCEKMSKKKKEKTGVFRVKVSLKNSY